MGLMGSSAAAVPEYLAPLGEREMERKDEFWDSLFKKEIPVSLNLRSAFEDLFVKQPENLALSVRVCAEKLSRLVNNEQTHPNEFITVFSILRQVLPVLVSHNQHIKLFGQVMDNKSRMGVCLVECLGRSLHLEGVTLRSGSRVWCESSDERELGAVRLSVVESLLLLKQIGVNFTKFECDLFVESVASLTSSYLESTSRQSMKVTAKLLSACYLLILSCDRVVIPSDEKDLFRNVINGSDKFFSKEEYGTAVLPILFNIVKIATMNDGIIDSSGVSLVLNALHCIDTMANKDKELISLFALAAILSFPSTCIALNEPCRSFDSDTPVHRGTYADILLEIMSRASPKFVKMNSLIVSAVIPYAANLSYGSALHIFRLLSIAYRTKHTQSMKSLVCAVHYLINRSICENVPLVIVLLKNSKMLLTIYKEDPGFEECEQLVSLIRNVNQELKQFGTRMNASELEKFFSDPSCEHFTMPVLRPPQTDFDFASLLGQNITNLSAYYVFSQLEVTPKSRDDPAPA